MKKWFFPLLAAALLVSACGVMGSETREERAAREAREAQMVRQGVDDADFSIDITRMYPLRGSAKTVTNYVVRVEDGVLISHLPYIGRAWRVPYGGGHALNFDAPIAQYSVSPYGKDGYEIRILVKTDEDQHLYRFIIFDNGTANLDVQSNNRERISFSGMFDFYREEE